METLRPNESPLRANAAELGARYLLERAIEHVGPRAFQGARNPPIPCRSPSPTVRRFATERFYRVPALAAEALVAWAHGIRVETLTHVPDARDVLDLQARGARCVSLLPVSADTSPYANRFEFVIHDLCHLGKLVCSPYYAEQVGFFSTLRAALDGPAWRPLESLTDADFGRDLDHVSADINGSSVFLFAVLKMKLKMAARRRLARERGDPPPSRGALSNAEADVFRVLFELTLDAFRFDEPLRSAAWRTSARRDAPETAALLADYFRRTGLVIISEETA